MASVVATLKSRIHTRLARSGIAIIRAEPRTRPVEVSYTAAELEKLEHDIAGLDLSDQEYWSTPEQVRGYLSNERVNGYHHVLDASLERGAPVDGGRILDVGTCSGYLLRIVEERFPSCSLHGTEYYEDFLRLARGLVPKATITRGGMAELAASDERFDVIYCTEVLEHILDTETPIPTLLGLLDPGGALVLTVPNGRYDSLSSMDSDDGNSFGGHVNFWSPESWAFYVDRVAPDARKEFGSLSGTFDDDVLFAILFKD